MERFIGFPFIIGWELTLACNLRCAHCASRAGLARPGELSRDEAFAIADQFPPLLVYEVVFTGGEPLLSPLWEPLARHLGEREIRVGVVTNGTLLDRGMLARLKAAGIGSFAVSLDGLRETHDRLRVAPGLYDRVITGMGGAVAAGLNPTVITTVNALNVGELDGLYAELKNRGVRRWQLQPIFAFGRSGDHADLQLSSTQYMQLGRFIRDVQADAHRSEFNVFGADGVGYCSELVVDDPPPWGGCGAGVATCGIMSDGRVKGCLTWPDSMIEGSLRDRDLWDLWFDDHSFRQTRHFTREDMTGACRDCPFALECGGGCNAISLASTGRLHGDPYCFRAIESATPADESARVPPCESMAS